MPSKNKPGCNCCSCLIFEDLFTRANSSSVGSDYTEVAGDWAIASNKLTVPDNDAILSLATAVPGSVSSYVMQVRASLRVNIVYRFLFAYTDANNYYAVEYEKTASGSSTVEVRFIERIAGTSTQIGRTEETLSVFSDADFYLRVAWDGAYVTAQYPATSGGALAFAYSRPIQGTFTSLNVAIGTGTNTGTIDATFDELQLTYHYNDRSNCYDVIFTCNKCDDDAQIASDYDIEFDGVAEGTGGSPCPAGTAATFNSTIYSFSRSNSAIDLFDNFLCLYSTVTLDYCTPTNTFKRMRLSVFRYDANGTSPPGAYTGTATVDVTRYIFEPMFITGFSESPACALWSDVNPHNCADVQVLSTYVANPSGIGSAKLDFSAATATLTPNGTAL
jgi:hypothetical protein